MNLRKIAALTALVVFVFHLFLFRARLFTAFPEFIVLSITIPIFTGLLLVGLIFSFFKGGVSIKRDLFPNFMGFLGYSLLFSLLIVASVFSGFSRKFAMIGYSLVTIPADEEVTAQNPKIQPVRDSESAIQLSEQSPQWKEFLMKRVTHEQFLKPTTHWIAFANKRDHSWIVTWDTGAAVPNYRCSLEIRENSQILPNSMNCKYSPRK